MIQFALWVTYVFIGAFVMFYISDRSLRSMAISKPTLWVILVGLLTFGVMIFYRVIGFGINIPSFTTLFFIITLSGMDSNFNYESGCFIKPIIRKARVSAIVGACIGWLFYAKVAVI